MYKRHNREKRRKKIKELSAMSCKTAGLENAKLKSFDRKELPIFANPWEELIGITNSEAFKILENLINNNGFKRGRYEGNYHRSKKRKKKKR